MMTVLILAYVFLSYLSIIHFLALCVHS